MFRPIWAANVEEVSVLYTEISGFPKNMTFSLSYTKSHYFQNICVFYRVKAVGK